MPTPTPLFRAYSAITRAVLPVAAFMERRKLKQAGLLARWGEKLGRSSWKRTDGQLIWFHAASVGESQAILVLIDKLHAARPKTQLLVTSGTATSAKLLAARLPDGVRHQFAPLDAPGPVRRFLNHWHPDAAIFVESELWPHMLYLCQSADIPLALVNARLSARSLSRWARYPDTAKMLLSGFSLMLTQNAQMADALIALGADKTRVAAGINLKSLAAPLPVNDALRKDMAQALGTRPVWIAASTHDGEEEAVLAAHETLLKTQPDLCLILAPRHPNRGELVADMITARGWTAQRRSLGALPTSAAQVYLADTLGELGTWYALSKIVFLGGSLKPIGGHNPFEVAQAGAAVLSGTHVSNFVETFSGLEATGGAVMVANADTLAACVQTWLQDKEALRGATAAAQAFCAAQDGALDDITDRLTAALELDRSHPLA